MDILKTSMSAIGKQISEEGRTRAEVENLADAVGDMLAGYFLTQIKAPCAP